MDEDDSDESVGDGTFLECISHMIEGIVGFVYSLRRVLVPPSASSLDQFYEITNGSSSSKNNIAANLEKSSSGNASDRDDSPKIDWCAYELDRCREMCVSL